MCGVSLSSPQPDNLSSLTRCLTLDHNTLVLVANTTGLGETRRVRTGTLGWTPLENVLGDVEAAPNQDSFAVGVDLCFILAHPTWKTEVVAMWSHSVRGVSVACGASV